jgi:cation diffusion facilitator CzcD-associated flavoprotein CzcO
MPSTQVNTCQVAVIGAGPYGLSVAAHLKKAGVATHVFGEPMAFWRGNMPKGMILRSPWRATHLSDPDNALSLDTYADAHGIARGKPLPLEKFVAYGEWFQQHAVPDVDRRPVRAIDKAASGFRLKLDGREIVSADRVVIATGLLNQEYRPPIFDDLPRTLVSHASEHTDLSVFRGKRVGVIGRGQSATESAALLAEAGAQAEIISRGDIHWLGISAQPATRRTLRRRLRAALASPSEVGPFPLSWPVEVPGLVRHMPAATREEFSRRCLKAAAAGWLKPRFADVTCRKVDAIVAARARGERVALDFGDSAQVFDHVLLGTGYRVDISRLGILAPQLLDQIARTDGSPLLGRGLESSVPGLHFVGSYAVKSFGPGLRFVAGAPYAASGVAQAILRRAPSKRTGPEPAESVFGVVAAPTPWPPQ